MATELELRNKVVDVMRGWLDYSEANGKFKAIIDLYNSQRPLPRGYKLQYDDEWCAATVTAAGIAAGLQSIILGECSCKEMIAKYQAAGRWQERDDYVPTMGDGIMYYWKDGKDFATTDCTANPNHVGLVEAVEGRTITVLEGNKGEAVARRTLAVNGRYIRGFFLPDYAGAAAQMEDDDMDQSRFNEMFRTAMTDYRKTLQDNDAGSWSKDTREWAVSVGLIQGNGTDSTGQPNMMWEDTVSREQDITIAKRLYDLIMKDVKSMIEQAISQMAGEA